VLSRLSLNLAGRLWALLLALTVLAHATVPFEAPLQARAGSAFSAATADLAVAPERKVQVQRAMVPVTPPRPVATLAPPAPATESADHLWPPQTAPPAPAPLLLRPAPRAPPLT
jgi:hypothetical protein